MDDVLDTNDSQYTQSESRAQEEPNYQQPQIPQHLEETKQAISESDKLDSVIDRNQGTEVDQDNPHDALPSLKFIQYCINPKPIVVIYCEDFSDSESSCSMDYPKNYDIAKSSLQLELASDEVLDQEHKTTYDDYGTVLNEYLFRTAKIVTSEKPNECSDMGRLSKEVKILSKNLPCSKGGSIFVVMDDDYMTSFRALLSGPIDTPYCYGLYEFSIELPQDFPNSPPVVLIETTGNNQSRFNPNLYDDGYVCLSIINTWDGDPEERWNPNYSNILQVLVSIQSLVMDEYIVQKEPDYDYLSKDSKENQQYSSIVKYNNIKYAMIDQIRNSKGYFKDVVKQHFTLIKEDLIKTVKMWVEEAQTIEDNEIFKYPDGLISDHNWKTLEIFESKGYKNSLQELLQELELLLENLDNPDAVKVQENQQEQKPLQLNQPSEEDPIAPVSQSQYYQELGQFSVNSVDMQGEDEYEVQQNIAKRLNTEIRILSTNLPCEKDSSIFVIYDQDRLIRMKALISGPVDTPYEHGLYLFSIEIPETYPEDPPDIKIETTGDGQVRFNPNLYNDGFVCLSIINTWEGEPESKWNPQFSSIQQVLISIQALVMDSLILQKEPGYEYLDSEHESSLLYQYIVKYANMKYAIANMINHKALGFEEVITKHFSLKKDDILATIDKWVQEAKEEQRDLLNDYDSMVARQNGSLFQQLQSEGLVQMMESAANEVRLALDSLN